MPSRIFLFLSIVLLIGYPWDGPIQFGLCDKDKISDPLLSDNEGTTNGLSAIASGIRNILNNTDIFRSLIVVVVIAQAIILYTNGQPLISKSGKIMLWVGDVNGPENSQQIFDWYTFSHIVHGFIFYWTGIAIETIFPVLNVGIRGLFILALLLEILWELVENSPLVIQRYRQQALSQGYIGDTVLNSLSDTGSMSFGFWLSSLLPLWLSILLVILEELFLLFAIRDNLTLNVIQLIRPSPAISKWQSEGHKKST